MAILKNKFKNKVSITVVTEEGVSNSNILEEHSIEEVVRRISKFAEWDDLTGLVFVSGKGKVLETAPPYSPTKMDSVAKIVTGYYDG